MQVDKETVEVFTLSMNKQEALMLTVILGKVGGGGVLMDFSGEIYYLLLGKLGIGVFDRTYEELSKKVLETMCVQK